MEIEDSNMQFVAEISEFFHDDQMLNLGHPINILQERINRQMNDHEFEIDNEENINEFAKRDVFRFISFILTFLSLSCYFLLVIIYLLFALILF